MRQLSVKDLRQLMENKFCPVIVCSNFICPGQNNNYRDLDPFARKKGIYHFSDLEGKSLYIGTAGFGQVQRLKKRVTQHLTAKDKGGTFRQKVAAAMFGDDQTKAAAWILQYTRVQLVETPPAEHSLLEDIAIAVFAPEYN